MSIKMTILTDPIPSGLQLLTETAKAWGRPIKRLLQPVPYYMIGNKYRGHVAVTRSLVEGMTKIGASFNYNPSKLKDVSEIVVVLSGVGTLRQAIQWKKQGRIRKLLAGPNILVWPTEYPEIGCPEVDICITPCDWTCAAYELDLPILKNRCTPWPAGVDVEDWKPMPHTSVRKKSILFYIKTQKGPIPDVTPYYEAATNHGYLIQEVHYSKYLPQDFKCKLDECSLMIGFSRDESQGIAWAEAWAMDVPTLMWKNEMNVIRGKETITSVAPYLSPQNGCYFDDVGSLSHLLDTLDAGEISFSPRQWVLENMSDEVCASNLLKIAGIN